MSYLTDPCGSGGYTLAAGKATLKGVGGGGVWGAGKATNNGTFYYSDRLEEVVIGVAVGSGLGIMLGVKHAHDGFKADTAECSYSKTLSKTTYSTS